MTVAAEAGAGGAPREVGGSDEGAGGGRRDLTAAEFDALAAYAMRHGRGWRARLARAWAAGEDTGPVLNALRDARAAVALRGPVFRRPPPAHGGRRRRRPARRPPPPDPFGVPREERIAGFHHLALYRGVDRVDLAYVQRRGHAAWVPVPERWRRLARDGAYVVRLDGAVRSIAAGETPGAPARVSRRPR